MWLETLPVGNYYLNWGIPCTHLTFGAGIKCTMWTAKHPGFKCLPITLNVLGRRFLVTFGFLTSLTCQLTWSFGHEGLMAEWKFFEKELFSFQTWFSRPQHSADRICIAQWIHVSPPRLLLKSLKIYITYGVVSQVLGHSCIFAVDP